MYLSPVCLVPCRLVYSLFPVWLPCPVLPLMLSVKTIILKYLLVCLFLVPPWCVHPNRRPDLTVSVVPSPRFDLFVFSSVSLFQSFVPHVRGAGVYAAVRGSPIPRFAGLHARRSRLCHPAVRGSSCRRSREFMPPFAALPSRRSRELTPPFAALPSRRSRELTPPFAGVHAAVRGSSSPQFPGDDATIQG